MRLATPRPSKASKLGRLGIFSLFLPVDAKIEKASGLTRLGSRRWLPVEPPAQYFMPPRDFTPIDTLVTDYCDTDSKWGPLLFLRPARSKHWSLARCLILAAFPGLFLGLLGSILFALIARQFDRPALPVYFLPVVLTTAYFAACRIILAPSWNRRANLLSGRRGS